MYADRRTGPDGWRSGSFKPGSLGIALAVNGLVIGALFYAAPALVPFLPGADKPPIEIYNIPVDPPPEPMPLEKTVEQPRPAPRPDAPVTLVPTPSTDGFAVTPDPTPYVTPPAVEGSGTGGGGVVVDPPKPAPVFVAPGIDPRYAADFQPSYPAQERRAEREGRVVVRVLVGTDGRVKQVERISATSDAFYRTTLDRALGKWRFTPGTRDGVAVETWKTMALTFVLEN